MTKAQLGRLRAQIVWLQYDVLLKARRGLKGLRLGHLWAIRLLGENGGPMRAIELSKLGGVGRSPATRRLLRAVDAGYVVKDGIYYRLSENGKMVFTRVNQLTAEGMNKLVASVISEARKAG